MELPSDYPQILLARLINPSSNPLVSHTVLALAGEEGIVQVMPKVRDVLSGENPDEVVRGALYAVGRLGEKGDRSLVTQYSTHSNPLVSIAAKAALERLDSRTGDG